MRSVLSLVFGGVVAAVALPSQAPGTNAAPTIAERMRDANWLWQRPVAGERCVQFSSYDRRSDAGPGDASKWYANHDRGNYLRVEDGDNGKEHVMVDVDGPGVLSRLWSANPAGTLHFDIDGQRVWSVDFAKLCSGAVENVPQPLAAMRSRGGNVYLPIPFARHLKISSSAGDLYYLADVLRLPASTTVASFAPERLAEHGRRADSLCGRAMAPAPQYDTAIWVATPRWQVPAGRLVQRFLVEFAEGLDDDEQREVLSRVLLVIRCGDEETVRVPVADFFALGAGMVPHAGRFFVVDQRRAECWFPMPMPDGGVIEILAEEDVGAFAPKIARVDHSELTAKDPMQFRASYHLAKATKTRPFSDHLVLDAKGSGRFVGCSLLVRNPSRIWWGEGDEKVWVDGEAFPSWFGTGTEDYFGYAWCDPTPFQAPFHAQVACEGPMNFGFTQLQRTHLLDSIPFQSSLRFEFERWHWVEDLAIDYASVAYWYAAAGASDGLPEVPKPADRLLERLPQPKMFVAEHAIEGETLRVLSCSGGVHEVQNLAFFDGRFSRDAHRWWRDGKPGDAIELAVPVPEDGRYRVHLTMTRANDFGIVTIKLAEQSLGTFDGYSEQVGPSGPFVAGTASLKAGEATLRFELTGRHAKAKPRFMVGLDYLRLEKVQ